jgi:5'-3' exoribonuclease 2
MKTVPIKFLGLFVAVLLSGCAGGPNAQSGTLIGAGTGALAGGIIGHQSGNTAAGAIIGGVAGGAVGNAVGNSQDQRNYYGRRYYDPYERRYGY